MTTSLLSVCSGELSDVDLQVLKDYALSPTTPWEWRKALEALVERAKSDMDAEELQHELDDVCSNVREARDDVEEVINRLSEPGFVLDTGELTKAAAEITKVMTELVASLPGEDEK